MSEVTAYKRRGHDNENNGNRYVFWRLLVEKGQHARISARSQTSGKLDELRALVFGAQYFDVANFERTERYRGLLTINDAGASISLTDPLSDLQTDWVAEAKGISQWAQCIHSDISEYLFNSGEKDVRTRLMTDYKEGKAYSYFDSKWLQEVFSMR